MNNYNIVKYYFTFNYVIMSKMTAYLNICYK